MRAFFKPEMERMNINDDNIQDLIAKVHFSNEIPTIKEVGKKSNLLLGEYEIPELSKVEFKDGSSYNLNAHQFEKLANYLLERRKRIKALINSKNKQIAFLEKEEGE